MIAPYVVEASEDGGFLAYNDNLRAVAWGPTEDEARANFDESVDALVDYTGWTEAELRLAWGDR